MFSKMNFEKIKFLIAGFLATILIFTLPGWLLYQKYQFINLLEENIKASQKIVLTSQGEEHYTQADFLNLFEKSSQLTSKEDPKSQSDLQLTIKKYNQLISNYKILINKNSHYLVAYEHIVEKEQLMNDLNADEILMITFSGLNSENLKMTLEKLKLAQTGNQEKIDILKTKKLEKSIREKFSSQDQKSLKEFDQISTEQALLVQDYTVSLSALVKTLLKSLKMGKTQQNQEISDQKKAETYLETSRELTKITEETQKPETPELENFFLKMTELTQNLSLVYQKKAETLKGEPASEELTRLAKTIPVLETELLTARDNIIKIYYQKNQILSKTSQQLKQKMNKSEEFKQLDELESQIALVRNNLLIETKKLKTMGIMKWFY